MGNAASAVPYGAQISQIYGALAMLTSIDEAIHDFPTQLSLTAPLVAGAGQQVYFSDAVGSVQLPDFYAALYGSTQYNATVELMLGLTGASPPSYTIHQSVSKRWSDSNATVLNFPQTRAVLGPIGPFTLGQAGSNADLTIVDMSVTVQYQDASGAPVGRSSSTRPEYAFYLQNVQGYQYVVSSTVVDNSSGPPLQPSNGFPGLFPAINLNEKTTLANVAIDCSQQNSLGRSTSNAFNLTTGGTGPAVVMSGNSFSFKNYNNYLTLPADFVGLLSTTNASGSGGTEVLSVSLGQTAEVQNISPGLGLMLSNASPDGIDVARQFRSTNNDEGNPLSTGYYIPANDYKPEHIALPRTESLTLGPFTAGANGTQISASFTSLVALVSVEDADHGRIGQATVVCQALSAISFLSAPIIAA